MNMLWHKKIAVVTANRSKQCAIQPPRCAYHLRLHFEVDHLLGGVLRGLGDLHRYLHLVRPKQPGEENVVSLGT